MNWLYLAAWVGFLLVFAWITDVHFRAMEEAPGEALAAFLGLEQDQPCQCGRREHEQMRHVPEGSGVCMPVRETVEG